MRPSIPPETHSAAPDPSNLHRVGLGSGLGTGHRCRSGENRGPPVSTQVETREPGCARRRQGNGEDEILLAPGGIGDLAGCEGEAEHGATIGSPPLEGVRPCLSGEAGTSVDLEGRLEHELSVEHVAPYHEARLDRLASHRAEKRWTRRK